MGDVTSHERLIAGRHTLEGLDETRLVWEEQNALVIDIAVRVKWVKLLKQCILADAHHCSLLRQILVVLGGGDVVEGSDLAQVGVRARLGLGALGRVALEEFRVVVLGHQVQPALPQLLEQRGGAADARAPAGGLRAHQAQLPEGVVRRGGVHDALELGQVRTLEPQAVLGDDEVELVPGGLEPQLDRQRAGGPHAPVLVRQVQVALLRDGEGR
mmetsp:Transcript_48467/g.137011  ORF Transcript_48467/g.137011 Transcript_48467/m.137011 type:complete len:214 (+) Transcript_48467:236-877(+)